MSEMTREQMVEFPDDCDFWTTEQWRAVAKRYHAEWRKSALTARSEGLEEGDKLLQAKRSGYDEGFREGVEAAAKLADADGRFGLAAG